MHLCKIDWEYDGDGRGTILLRKCEMGLDMIRVFDCPQDPAKITIGCVVDDCTKGV